MRLTIRDMAFVSLFTALAVSAALVLRFGGEAVVPFSLLPLVVMLAGSLLGARLGALSMIVYILLGLVGVPVFAKPPYGGLTYILQPSFGFLPGFVAAAYVIGRILERKEQKSFLSYFLASVVGIVVIYIIGIPYLYIILNFYLGKAVSVMQALKIGFLPFILFDLAKAVVTALIARPVAEQVRTARISRS
ncbi:BioY protein [Thermincola ferriacetica]|uniref:Biotin transporter n=1 Tax=Thermincola ferriacetica TaxID=281456 RepID=A0A0L6W0C8_9FIRM|nr:biotin transporter BioY [Thermincola ferriacetica]KNZ68863.1 BioY protein [Thermincola ferriacetica]